MTQSTLKSLRITLTDRLSDLLGPPSEPKGVYHLTAIYDIQAVAAKHGAAASDIEVEYVYADGNVIGLNATFSIDDADVAVNIEPASDLDVRRVSVYSHGHTTDNTIAGSYTTTP